jgi:hypothetical protein
VPTLNDVLAGSQAQAVQVQQIIDALKGTPNKGVPVALVSLNDPNNYALTVQNDDPVNSRALSVLKADGTTLISADATGVTLGAPVNVPPGSISGTAIAAGSITNAMLGADVARANLLTNGGFEIWQRGNGPFTGAGTAFGPDRYAMSLAGTDTLSVSKNTANVDVGSSACAACTFVLGTGAGATALFQTLKAADGSQLAGRTVSASCRVSVNVANAVRVALTYDGTGGGVTYSVFHTGSGAYQTLTVTATIPANATTVTFAVYFAASCTAYLDNANLVVGAQPANYVPLHPADDLARCLRYYEIMGSPGSADISFNAYQAAGSFIGIPMTHRVIKAVAPTTTKVGTWAVTNCGQPSIAAPSTYGYQLAAAVTALGNATINSSNAGNTITVESNP